MSTIFDSIGIDPGIVIIVLLIVVLVLIGTTISSNMRLTRLERKYKMFMKGSDAQSLEKTFVRKFAQIDHLYETKEEHEQAIRTLAKHFKLLYSKYGVEKYDSRFAGRRAAHHPQPLHQLCRGAGPAGAVRPLLRRTGGGQKDRRAYLRHK